MTKETLAALLNGREYGDEITREEEARAKAARLVTVFGYSDDNIELRGAIHGEAGCFGGKTFRVDDEGIHPTWEDGDDKSLEDAREFFRRESKPFKMLTAIWSAEGYSWVYKTDLPHATFEIMEDGQKFCRGIVFSLEDLK